MLKRVITALILLIPVIAAIIYLPPSLFVLLSGLILLYGGWEWTNLVNIRNTWGKIFFLLFLIIIFLIFGLLRYHLALYIGIMGWIIVAKTLLTLTYNHKNLKNTFLASKWAAIFVFAPCWIGLNLLKAHGGSEWVLAGLIIVWITDTAAYFTGKYFGKRPLAIHISPNKTIEGVIG